VGEGLEPVPMTGKASLILLLRGQNTCSVKANSTFVSDISNLKKICNKIFAIAVENKEYIYCTLLLTQNISSQIVSRVLNNTQC
jgi:hypothetical protein